MRASGAPRSAAPGRQAGAENDRICRNRRSPRGSDELRALGERLLGRWKVSGGAEGEVGYEWLEGGDFLVQHVDLRQHGMEIRGIEIIGNDRPFGAPPREEIRSRFFDNHGNTLEYVYELDGDHLTIWGGEKGSPAHYTGTFQGNELSGAWVYPGGGGYESTAERIS